MKHYILLLSLLSVAFFAYGNDDIRTLIESASKFPPVDDVVIKNAVKDIKNLPNAEEAVWDFIEGAEITVPFQIENSFVVLERAGLIGPYSLARSREVLEANFDFDFTFAEKEAEENSFGFGTPTGPQSVEKLRMISLVGSSIQILSDHGAPSDMKRIEPFTKSKSVEVKEKADEAVRLLKERSSMVPMEKVAEKLPFSREVGELSIPAIEKSLSETANSPQPTTRSPVWPYAVVGIALLLMLIILLQSARRKGNGGESGKPSSP